MDSKIISSQHNHLTEIKNIDLTVVKIDSDYKYREFTKQLRHLDWTKIESFLQLKDKITAFTSQVLQKYYLASKLGINFAELVIDYKADLKPYISLPRWAKDNYHFNVSHSYQYVVMAIYQGSKYKVGVDIELIDNQIDVDSLKKIVFSASEQRLIGNSITNFFKLWTKKEALIKAIGYGFTNDFFQTTNLNLDDIEIKENYIIVTQQIENYFLSYALYADSYSN